MKISIVVTIYKREHLIPQVLYCLASQSHSDWEAIFIADGPHSHARKIVDDYGKTSTRPIRYRTAPRAPGCFGNVSRYMGLQIAEGDYVCFLGHDCLIDPGYLQAHAEAAGQEPCLSVVQCRYWTVRDPQGRPYEVPRFKGILPPRVSPERWRMGSVDLTCMAFERDSALRYGVFGKAMQREYAADWLSFDRCRSAGLPVVFTPQVLCAHF